MKPNKSLDKARRECSLVFLRCKDGPKMAEGLDCERCDGSGYGGLVWSQHYIGVSVQDTR